MATPFFLYPSLTDDIKEGLFQARKYSFSYTDCDGSEKKLRCETLEGGSVTNCIRTDGVWNADRDNLLVRRAIALKNYRKLFGPEGLVCINARLGVAIVWMSPDSRQRGAETVMEFGVDKTQLTEEDDHTFIEREINFEFPGAKVRGDIRLSVVLYIAKAGKPSEKEMHLANEEGFVLGEFDSFVFRIDGTGSLFPVFEIYDKDQPLWNVRCDWVDPISDSFSETVSININTAHKNFRYIDRKQKVFCSQLLAEVMSSALCCIIEKVRSEKYLDQILGDGEMEAGSVGEAIRYFADTLEWDLSTPDKASFSMRKFFDGRLVD